MDPFSFIHLSVHVSDSVGTNRVAGRLLGSNVPSTACRCWGYANNKTGMGPAHMKRPGPRKGKQVNESVSRPHTQRKQARVTAGEQGTDM